MTARLYPGIGIIDADNATRLYPGAGIIGNTVPPPVEGWFSTLDDVTANIQGEARFRGPLASTLAGPSAAFSGTVYRAKAVIAPTLENVKGALIVGNGNKPEKRDIAMLGTVNNTASFMASTLQGTTLSGVGTYTVINRVTINATLGDDYTDTAPWTATWTAGGDFLVHLTQGATASFQGQHTPNITADMAAILGDDAASFSAQNYPKINVTLAATLGLDTAAWIGFVPAYNAINETLSLSDQLRPGYVHLIAQTLAINSSVNPTGLYQGIFSDTLRLTERITLVHDLIAAESLLLSESLDIERALAIVEMLSAAGLAETQLEAIGLLASAMVLADLIRHGTDADVTDALSISDSIAARWAGLVEAIESATLSDTATETLRITALVPESLSITESLDPTLALISALSESLAITATYNLGASAYQGYVMNAENGALSTYSNYPFNSFATLRGRTLAAAEDGLFELTGDSDAGNPIYATLRTGLMNLGSPYQKRIDHAAIGYTAAGELVLKTIVSEDGVKRERWYQATLRSASAPTQNVIKVGKGIRSAYWSLELTNLDGGAFDLDLIRLWPVVLSREI